MILCFVVLASLTKAMMTPIPREKPAPDDLDLAHVGLDVPPKAPLAAGAGPSARASPVGGG